MDKVKVNNQVVSMRKYVKRAKVLAINKYSKQIKQLQNKKGNESQTEKNLRKVERLLEKVKILKKMMPDLVSKKALSKSQDWNVLLTEKNTSLEDQCLALLANDSELQKAVEKFHTEQSHLVEKIPTLILEWEVKSQTNKSPEKKIKASDIRKLKQDKIAKRKRSNFKNPTFPNNVEVDKKLPSSQTNKRQRQIPVPKTSPGDVCSEEEKMQVEAVNPEETPANDDGFSDLQPLEEPSDHSENSHSDEEDFFSRTPSNKTGKNQQVDDKEESDIEMSHDSNQSESEGEDFFDKSSNENQMNGKPNRQSTKEPQNNNSEKEMAEKSDLRKLNAKSFRNKNLNSNSTPNQESKNDSSQQLSLIERLHLIANTDSKKLNARQSKSNTSTKNTKAISVLDLNELKNSDRIPIQNTPAADTEDTDSPTVVPKKDSFFLTGDEEPESEEETTNNKGRHFKNKFSNFRDKSGGRFNNRRFDDRSFKSRIFKGKEFDGNERGFRKPIKGRFDDRKKFNDKSHSFKKFSSEKTNGSPNFRSDKNRNSKKDTFQPKTQSTEKPEKMHPSWEAKNKLKEAAKSGFLGKRIVFD